MNTRVLSRLSIFSISVAFCLLCVHQATAQQETNTPADKVVAPTDNDVNEIPSDETADSAMEENNDSPDAVPEELETPNPAEEAFQSALQHEKENDLDKAIEDCTKAITSDPKNLEYLSSRGELYGEQRNYEKALEDAAKILEKDPNNLRARLLRGRMFQLSGKAEKALTEFNAAVERNPTNWQALSARQNYFEIQGQHEKALADSMRIIQLEPNLPAGYLSQALSHAAMAESDKAMIYASALVQQDPENPLAYAVRAAARGPRGDYDGAKDDAEMAVKLAPDNPITHCIRGYAFVAVGEYEKGLADLRKAVDLRPRSWEWKVGLADILATCPDGALRDGIEAAELVSDALKSAPNSPQVWRAAAAAAAENGNFEEAIKWQQRVVDSPGITAALNREHQERLEAYKASKPYRHKAPGAKSSSK